MWTFSNEVNKTIKFLSAEKESSNPETNPNCDEGQTDVN